MGMSLDQQQRGEKDCDCGQQDWRDQIVPIVSPAQMLVRRTLSAKALYAPALLATLPLVLRVRPTASAQIRVLLAGQLGAVIIRATTVTRLLIR
jgi:hypothetical protein